MMLAQQAAMHQQQANAQAQAGQGHGQPNPLNPQQRAAQSMLQHQMLQRQTPQQQTMAEMDGLDIPPIFQSNTNMPQGIPPDIRKWGQLKFWASQNPNLSPDMTENVRRLQIMHYQQMVRARTQQQGQTAPMQAGAQGGQMGKPTTPMVQPPTVGTSTVPVVDRFRQVSEQANGIEPDTVHENQLGTGSNSSPNTINNKRGRPTVTEGIQGNGTQPNISSSGRNHDLQDYQMQLMLFRTRK